MSERPTRNPFDVLGVAEEAEIEVIRAAYRALARKYHPDVNAGARRGDLTRRMMEINWAKDELEADLAGWRTRVSGQRRDSRNHGDRASARTKGRPPTPKTISAACPSCGRRFFVDRPGKLACKKCGWRFEIDSRGTVTKGTPILTKCPSCLENVKVADGGEVSCPECEWDFAVDTRGAVTDCVPIDTACPSCREDLKIHPDGNTDCPLCGAKFYVDLIGRVFPPT